MILKQVSAPTSALPSQPERPFKFVWPVAASDGSVGYDRPLENYFDSSMTQRLLPSIPPSRLYDTVARAHDHRYQLSPDMLDPSWSTPRPLTHRERHRSLARLSGDTPDYMGISPDLPGWRPRRSSYEDRRGAVSVTPVEVNSLVPSIPPIDTTFPPPSKEWLDRMAKDILAKAHAEFDNPPPTDVTSSPDEDDTMFNYDTDSTLDGVVTPPRTSAPSSSQQESESTSRDADFNSNTDTDTDSDTDTDTDDGYDWDAPPVPHSGPGSRWLIPRKRPSVVIANDKLPSPPHEKRSGGGKSGFSRVAKAPKTHENDSPARHSRNSLPTTRNERDSRKERPSSLAPLSSITATALQMNQVRIASPGIASPHQVPQPIASISAPAKSPKVFPCMLDGCNRVCASAGDLQRHQQSLRHHAPSHSCLACGKSYTRSDALKRHLNSKASCRKEHTAKLTSGNPQVEEEEEEGAEANDEAVHNLASSSG